MRMRKEIFLHLGAGMAESRWMFTKEQLQSTPSRKSGIDAEKELSYRQQAANLIQDMGQRLNVTQLCINTAIVYMHRYYMFQSFSRFPRNEMAPACLFLAAKLEEQPRKLEHVIKVAHSCLHRDNTPAPDPKTEAYLEQAQTLVINENILLQTLGFEVSVDHPHSHVVKATSLVKDFGAGKGLHNIQAYALYATKDASKDLAQTSYFLATNSLHLTTLCLQYRPTIVACVCIYLACKWSNWKIPRSHEGKEWYQYVDTSVTAELLDELYNEFLSILEKCPHKLRKKIMGWKGSSSESNKDMEHQEADFNKQYNKQMHHSDPNRHSSASSTSSSISFSHHKHTNHDRNSGGKHGHPEQKHSSSHSHGSRDDPKREWAQEKGRPPGVSSGSGGDKKMAPVDRKHGHLEHREREHAAARREHGASSQVKDSVHSSSHHHRPDSVQPEHRERSEVKTDHHDLQTVVKKESGERPHPFTHLSSGSMSRPDHSNVPVKKEPVDVQDGSQAAIDIRRSKSETSLHYKEYLKRKELEKQEKERKDAKEKDRLERERYEREKEKQLLKQRAESDQMNKSFPQDSVKREQKHRPPKLDMNLMTSETNAECRQAVSQDRPYEVNIKSPIKPHHNIVVKSPIKSSELKQPKLEITKMQLTPEKDGSEPVSVNIHSDPNIKKIISSRHEPHQDKVEAKLESSRARHEHKMKIKQEQGDRAWQKLELSDSIDFGVNVKSESSKDFNLKTQESENGDHIPDSAAAMRQAMKLDSSSGRNTPVSSQNRTDGGSGTSTPIRLKLNTSENSPLKIKISTKGLQNDSDAGSSKHDSPHRHRHKHKDKHKSHKRSKDRHRDKERHKEHDKHTSSTSSTSHGTNNGQPLKLSLKLSDHTGNSSSSNESWSVKQKHGHKKESSVSDTALNRNNNSLEGERQQPWSMSDLISKSSQPESESRKRRRATAADPNHDALSHPKNAKLESHRIRRSSSSHSIVSMEMSDEDNPGAGGDGGSTKIQLMDQSQVQVVNKLHESLQQAIEKRKLQISKMQRPPAIDRQQSGFDLDQMMWAGSGLPDAPPPPPPPPPLPPLPSNSPPRRPR